MSLESESFKRELERIEFRRALMELPGGSEWLLHVSRLFEFKERNLGPSGFGLPEELRMHKKEVVPVSVWSRVRSFILIFLNGIR